MSDPTPTTLQSPSALDDRPPIVELDNVGVMFNGYGGRQTMKNRLINRLFRPKRSFWALRDVSFTVHEGETIFVIGRNGAGKTTLLQVIGETLVPHTGSITAWGEITAFLSMGLGFCPPLSGNDNMELALQFLGAQQADIPRLREEILEFTQLGHFLDMPVKNYSAGMKARLAFAIATSLEPEILIMDEVINAGDEGFRTRCQERLNQMLDKARAIVICTHNLQNAREMADRVVWIEEGQVRAIGDPKETIREYCEFAKRICRDPFYDLKAREKRILAA